MVTRVHDRNGHADGLIQMVLVGEAVARGGYVVLVADENMRYLAASEAACSLFGYSREELLDLTVPDLVVESHASELYQEFIQSREQRGQITCAARTEAISPRPTTPVRRK